MPPTVTVVMVHFSEHIDSIRVERKIWCVDDTQGIQLVTERAFAKHELRCIRAIETIDAIRSADAVLHRHRCAPLIILALAVLTDQSTQSR